MVAISIASFLAANFQQKLETKLSDLKPVTQASGTGQITNEDAFSIGGVVLSEGMIFGPKSTEDKNEQRATLVYSVPPNSTSFRASFGIPDGFPAAWSSASLAVSVDGELVKTYDAQADAKPVKVEVPLKGAKSIKLVFSGYSALGDSFFSALTTKPTDTTPKPRTDTAGLPRVALTIWDEHDWVYLYGHLTSASSFLKTEGFTEGKPDIPFPHLHNEDPDQTSEMERLLAALPWVHTPVSNPH
jgi:hypothetical protein